MHHMVVPVFRVADAGNAHHFIGFFAVTVHHVPVGNDTLFLQSFPDRVRLDKTHELLPVLICNIFVGIGGDGSHIGKMFSHLEAVFHIGVGLVTDPFVLVQFQIIHAPVIGRQGGDQLALLLPQTPLPLFRLPFRFLDPAPAFRRDIGNKNVIDAPVGFRFRIVTEIVHPAHRPVLADDTVFHIV